MLDESSGNATDLGSDASWHLSAQGTPRRAVVIPLPVADVDATDNLVSVTAIFIANPGTDKRIYSQVDTEGYEAYIEAAGTIALAGDGSSTVVARGTTAVDDGAVHCVTLVFDGRTANAAKIYLDGSDDTSGTDDLSGTGSWNDSAKATIGNATGLGANSLLGGVLRLRLDETALSFADHQRLCGSIWSFDVRVAKVNIGDVIWTQTGGARCYDQSATTSLCVPGGEPGPAYSSGLSTLGWAAEKDRTNRLLQNTALDQSPWTVDATVVTNNAVGPHGLKSVESVTVTDASTLLQVAAGYTASTALNLELWAKCSAGTLKLQTNGEASGDWSINCGTVGGVWAHLTSAHAAVTQDTAWQSGSTGDATVIVTSDATGVSADIWAPTLTEVVGYSVIPTEGSAVSTGGVSFEIDNTPPDYFKGARGQLTCKADFVSAAANSGISFVGGAGNPPPGTVFYSAAAWWWYDGSTPNGIFKWRCAVTGGLSGVDEFRVWWNSTDLVTATEYAECFLNSVKQAWVVAPSSAWNSADPQTLFFNRASGALQNNAIWQQIKVENAP